MADFHKVRPNGRVLGIYTLNNVKLAFECEQGHVWKAAPNNILRGKWCPECRTRKPATHEEFCERVREVHPTIRVLDTYTGSMCHMRFQCGEGHVWKARASNVQSGKWCPFCANKSRSKKRIRAYTKRFFEKNPHKKNIDATIYLIQFGRGRNVFQKIGITSRTLEERWRGWNYQTLKTWDKTLYSCWEYEQAVVNEFSHLAYSPPCLKGNGSSECFKGLTLEEVESVIS